MLRAQQQLGSSDDGGGGMVGPIDPFDLTEPWLKPPTPPIPPQPGSYLSHR